MNKGILSIIFVYGIILSEYGIFTLIFIPAYYKTYQEWAILIGIEFTILYILIHYSYYLVQVTNPGSPNQDLAKQYHQQTLLDIQARTKKHVEQINKMRKRKLFKQFELAEEDDEILQAIDTSLSDIIQIIQLESYCFKCQNIKVPRAHHCKECKKCILKMDHHCYWVNNCVGLLNYRFFCQFQFYALTCLIQCSLFIFIDYCFNESIVLSELNANQRFLCWICAFTSLSLVLSMGYLLGFHIYLMTKNMTTVEYHIDEMKTDNPFKKPQTIDNMKEILGCDYLYWLLPLKEQQKSDQRISEAYEL